MVTLPTLSPFLTFKHVNLSTFKHGLQQQPHACFQSGMFGVRMGCGWVMCENGAGGAVVHHTWFLVMSPRTVCVLGVMLTVCRTAWKQTLERARQAAVLQGCAAPMAAIYVTAPIPAMVVHTGGAALVTQSYSLSLTLFPNPTPYH